MAKPRKPKNDDAAKSDNNSAALVRHQKLCLSIDLDHRQIHGHTELEIAVPEIGIVGLHAENLGIGSVLVDGEPAEFEYYPHPYARNAESDKRWSAVSTPSSAADVATSVYISALERELIPNLLINCCKGLKSVSVNEQPEQPPVVAENGFHPAGEAKQQNVRLIRIEYWVEKAEAGIHFKDNVVHTDNQIRRARCWFPCMDDSSQRCCYDLEFTVANNLVAVSNGSLLYQLQPTHQPQLPMQSDAKLRPLQPSQGQPRPCRPHLRPDHAAPPRSHSSTGSFAPRLHPSRPPLSSDLDNRPQAVLQRHRHLDWSLASRSYCRH